MKGTLIVLTLLEVLLLVLGAGFNVNTEDLQIHEMAQNINEMKGAVMGIAEFVQEINSNVKDVKYGVRHIQNDPSKVLSDLDRKESQRYKRWLSVDELLKREELAQKIEKLFNNENSTKVEAVKQEMTTVIETNFIRMLAAILITGPVQAQEKTPEIFRLMRNALNGKMDFKPVVDRLPFLLRSSETNQFIILLKALRDTERQNNQRQFGGLEDFGKVIDAAGKFDLKQVSGFLKELPKLFESIEEVVDGVDEYFE